MGTTEFAQLPIIKRVEAVEDLESEGLSAREIKAELGLTRYQLSHLKRLSRKLTPESRFLIQKNQLSEGHARALVRLSGRQQENMLRATLQYGWSVRKLENRIKDDLAGKDAGPDAAYFEQLAVHIGDTIGHPVKVKPNQANPSKGEIVITYLGLDAFDSVMERLKVRLDEQF
ncbi:MAG: hypothetical protein SWN10_13545 [Pseudomonadota bacterium]|uniref:hypothetical protein n=1 Tax=Marinobacter sp. G11 TaxID=2903522 RepID=UPI001E355CE0|nr:hypothetical protein [Marinobacter sp. G11]MCE0759476.1 hypothetical protein [Marinobacter sp. G11]MDY6928107.1 hypothetical protein [Pseudomonadota bacterium]